MHIIFDERETGLHERCLSLCAADTEMQLSKQVLPIGDVIITLTDINTPLIIIERKSIPDLLSSIKDGRYVEQSHRLIHASGLPTHNIMYLVEGMLHMIKENDKRIVYSAITSLNCLKGFSVLRTMNTQETSELIIGMSRKLKKEMDKGASLSFSSLATETTTNPVMSVPPPYSSVVKRVKKENITPENIFDIMLCQIPGISSIISAVIVEKCQNMEHLIHMLKKDSTCLDQLTYDCKGKRKKVSSAAINNIKLFICTSS